MLAFRFNQTLFTHTIAARDINDACRVISDQFKKQGASPNGDPVRYWHTPDVWTRRAVDMALAPGIIDTIPRFVVDRKDGPVYLDIDDVPGKLSDDEYDKCGQDSYTHREWLNALRFGRSYHDELRAHIAIVSSLGDGNGLRLRKTCIRALAGAWGLGPIPEWHAAILPALIALDDESLPQKQRLASNVFEMDRAELARHLDERLPAQQQIDDFVELVTSGSLQSLRESSTDVLRHLGWL